MKVKIDSTGSEINNTPVSYKQNNCRIKLAKMGQNLPIHLQLLFISFYISIRNKLNITKIQTKPRLTRDLILIMLLFHNTNKQNDILLHAYLQILKEQNKYQQRKKYQKSQEYNKRLQMYLQRVRSIDKKNLVELKSFKNPPIIVQEIVRVVCILFKIKPVKKKDFEGKFFFDYWAPSVKFLLQPDLIAKMMQFDKDSVDVNQLRKVKKMIENKDLTLQKAKISSRAAEGILNWIYGIYYYNEHKIYE